MPIVMVVAALALWLRDQQFEAAPPATWSPRSAPATPAGKSNGYEHYTGCTLVPEKHNDGDSFQVRLPDGREKVLRLYFVDAPESDFKTYRGGANNYQRIDDQAAEMGGISAKQAVEIGHRAKNDTLRLLAAAPFEIYTKWDSPFHDGRYHAFVRVLEDGREIWLHQLLIERGLARIKTKPAPLPDGTTVAAELAALRKSQAEAKRKRAGAWGM